MNEVKKEERRFGAGIRTVAASATGVVTTGLLVGACRGGRDGTDVMSLLKSGG